MQAEKVQEEKLYREDLFTYEERRRICLYCSRNLKKMRKAIGLRQEDLAFAVGTTQRHISEIENGKAVVSWTLLMAFSTILIRFPQVWRLADVKEAEVLENWLTNLKTEILEALIPEVELEASELSMVERTEETFPEIREREGGGHE